MAQPFPHQYLNCSSNGLASPPLPSGGVSSAPTSASPAPMALGPQLKPPEKQNIFARQTFWLQGAQAHSGHLRNPFFFFGGGHMAWNWEGLRYQDSIPNTSASSTFIRPLPWGAQARSLQGAFSQAERSTTGELLTSLGQVFPEATLGVQGNRELVLSTPLVASLTFPGQAPAQYCFLQRGQGSRAARRKC